MVIFENGKQNVQVRIHDDYCNADTQQSIQTASRIVSHSYKRRILETNKVTSKMESEVINLHDVKEV
ncbi:MAG: hypothetical protein R3Y24_11675 [Eubacteriales bacterium]